MIEALDSFFEWTAVTMEPIPPYGAFHILYTLIGFAVCGLTAWKLRRVSDKTAERILFGIGLVLMLSEIFKQLFYYFAIMDNCYSWNDFPFQLCSVPMYLCLIIPFLKQGKLKRGMYSFMVLYNLMGGVMPFTMPSEMLLDRWFLTIHSLLWHMILVFIGLFVCFSKRGGNTKSDYIEATRAFLVMCVISFGINCLVQYGLNEKINLFFVGPGNHPLFNQITNGLSWYIVTPLYVAALCLGAYITFCIVYLCQNKRLPFGKGKE